MLDVWRERLGLPRPWGVAFRRPRTRGRQPLAGASHPASLLPTGGVYNRPLADASGRSQVERGRLCGVVAGGSADVGGEDLVGAEASVGSGDADAEVDSLAVEQGERAVDGGRRGRG